MHKVTSFLRFYFASNTQLWGGSSVFWERTEGNVWLHTVPVADISKTTSLRKSRHLQKTWCNANISTLNTTVGGTTHSTDLCQVAAALYSIIRKNLHALYIFWQQQQYKAKAISSLQVWVLNQEHDIHVHSILIVPSPALFLMTLTRRRCIHSILWVVYLWWGHFSTASCASNNPESGGKC